MGNVCSISVPCDAVISRSLDCTARKATYISQLEDKVVALQNAMQKLIEARNDVMSRVIVAEQQQQMKRLNQVQGWLSRVQHMETRVVDLIIKDSTQEIDKLCFGGFCSKDCKSSYKFGKKVSKTIKVVTTLMADGANFQVVAERVPEAAVDEMPHEPLLVGLQSTLDKVWRCLAQEEEDQVRIIGLYGMGGVGKTTLLTQFNNKFVDTPNDFDTVIWVVVSKDLQLEKIQEIIAQRIGLCNESWKNKSLQEKARDIFKILSKKKFVLLLDDLWDRVDLTKIGVPLATPKNIGSKVVFTTRFIDICGLMESNRKFKVKCLTDEEALKLFQNKVGEDTLINSHPDILELAKSVAQECGGLPLALITIGRAMAYKKTPEEWKYAIQVLKRSASEFPGMGKEVYPLLKFSYDSLSDDKIRSCLLYCSLFSEDHNISKSCLIDCWIGEGILDENDYNQVQNRGYYIIGILLHACLLEEGREPDYVKMHDVIRDMALWIMCEIEKENVLIQAGAGLTEAPKIGKWEGVTRVSLMDNEIEDLLEFSTCSHLTTLFLHSNRLMTINSYFFQFMPSLKVLNLSSNRFLNELPPGISKLVSLQYLNLSKTPIRELPNELKSLVNLKCLNLEQMRFIRVIPRQLISSFSMLQVLRMFNYDSQDYIAQDSVLFGGHEFLVEELLCLKYINVLTITLKSSDALVRFLSSSKLRSCTQSLSLQSFSDSKSLNVLSLADVKHMQTLYIESEYLEELKIGGAQEVQSIRDTHGFRSLHTFNVYSCKKLRDLTWLVFAQNIKFLFVSNCLLMEEIVSAREIGQVPEMMGNLNPFGKLELLELTYLPHLKSIYCNALLFLHLKDVKVLKCRNLKKLPLDSNSTKERKIVIEGEEGWWKDLQWEDEATQNAFLPCFKSQSSS
ncbi:hypothetical protein Ddye_011345 [Dipteronia dyeriana]|uniref:NB-ARC domain-containing protein n=1 Tax=Dipteronia dyeriana TaxID=168575 RepID=A0AAE0CGS2_9ROSI|nr:hypothetical protein Ddye_011345 [Dipteronia dyeriana]